MTRAFIGDAVLRTNATKPEALVIGDVKSRDGMAEINVFLNNCRVRRGSGFFEPLTELVMIDRPVFDFDFVSHASKRRPETAVVNMYGNHPDRQGDFLQYS